MSGFDFDGLRDTNARAPGARERADVEARARQLRVRTRRNRLAMTATSLVAVVAVVFGIAAVRNNNKPEISVGGNSTTTATATTTEPTTAVPTTPTTPTTATKPPCCPTQSPTTTTLPAATPSGAVSASFVSADQGFVLEANGQVDATSDGGTTWHRVGSAGSVGLDGKIRFIDAADGFIFGPRVASPALSITHDGGATWTAVDTPFTAVSDLAISRDTVYVVGTLAGTTTRRVRLPGSASGRAPSLT